MRTLEALKPTMQSGKRSKRRHRRRYHFTLLNIRNLDKIAVGLLLLTLIITINGQDEEPDDGAPGDGAQGPDDGADGGAGGADGGPDGGAGGADGGPDGGAGGPDGGPDGGGGGAGGDGADGGPDGGGGGAGGGGAGGGAGGGGGSGGGGAGGGGAGGGGKEDELDMRMDDHGTTHEKLGQPHYPPVDLTRYKSDATYTQEKNYTTWPMHPAYNITHFIYDTLVYNKPALPSGYLIVKNSTTLALGPKVTENNWNDLLAEYFVLILIILFLLFLVIIMPFFAVCYCCFCCCRRCKLGCPPCDGPKDRRKALICSIILIALIILLIIGLLMAFVANRFLDRGFDDTSTTMKRSSEDTCTFLQDVSNHIHHVFIYNYEELEAHLTELMNEAANHIFLDLADSSESNAVPELERILTNMGEAKKILTDVAHLEKELRFNVAMLRDGLRGLKRDVTYTCTVLLANSKCKELMYYSMIQFLDSYNCLHLDKLPHTVIFVDAVNKILQTDMELIPKRALDRFRKIGDKIQIAMEGIIPAIRMDISRGHDLFQKEATKVRNYIDALISDIHMRTLQSTKSFEDIQDKIGSDRNTVNMIVCLFILLVVLALIAALIFGCCINKITGTHFLLLAIILIFCIFSAVLLIAIFYFIIGLVAYQGACAPLRDNEENTLFSQVDSEMDLNEFLPASGADRDSIKPLRMSKVIRGCMANESIFQLLEQHKIYSTDELMDLKILSDEDEEDKKGLNFDEDLTQFFMLTQVERNELEDMRTGNLSDYFSATYSERMCKPLTPDLKTIQTQLESLSNEINTISDVWNDYNRVGRISLKNEALHLHLYDKKYGTEILKLIDLMNKKLAKVDDLILYENRNFSNSIDVLVNAILRSERFITTQGTRYVNKLGENLTAELNAQIEDFVSDLANEIDHNIGRCAPLAYVYYRGVDLICYRLVDPLNAFWLGLFICCIAFIPILFIAHHLMCLWKRLHSYRVAPVAAVLPMTGCPTCTGTPFVPPPVYVCTGAKETFCVCAEGRQNRTDGGAAPSVITMHPNGTNNNNDNNNSHSNNDDKPTTDDDNIEAIPATSIAVISDPPVAARTTTTSKRKAD